MYISVDSVEQLIRNTSYSRNVVGSVVAFRGSIFVMINFDTFLYGHQSDFLYQMSLQNVIAYALITLQPICLLVICSRQNRGGLL